MPKGRTSKWTPKKIKELAEDMHKWYDEHPDSYLMVDYLADRRMKIATINELSKSTSIFADSYKILKIRLESRLCAAMAVMKNPTAAIFLLKNHYGYVDKTEQNITGNVTQQHADMLNKAWEKRAGKGTRGRSTEGAESLNLPSKPTAKLTGGTDPLAAPRHIPSPHRGTPSPDRKEQKEFKGLNDDALQKEIDELTGGGD